MLLSKWNPPFYARRVFAPRWILPSSQTSLFSRSLLSAAALIVIFAAGQAEPAAAESAAKKIQEIAESEDFERNQSLCDEILQSGPRKYAEYFCEGYEAIFRGQHQVASTSLDKAIEEQSDFALAALLYADAYKHLGDLGRAETYYQRAIEVQPKRSDTRFSLGALYLERAKKGDESYLPKALEAFRQMAQVSPNTPDGFTNMGVVLTEMGRFEDAEMILKKAIEKAPQDPFTHDNLAVLYSRNNQPEEAARLWRKALSINPGYGPATIELAQLHGRQGDLLKALQTLRTGERATIAPPWGPQIRRNLGFAYLGIGAIERSKEIFTTAAASGSQDALSHLGLAHMNMTEANVDAALTSFRRGAALDAEAAAPFVLAWMSAVEFALEDSDASPLGDLIEDLKSGGDLHASARGVIGGVTGFDATERLIGFVLPGWQFGDVSEIREQVEQMEDSVLEHGYDQAPVAKERVRAEYPDWAQEQGIQGEVLVRIVVDKEGRVKDASADLGSADQVLIESAINAAEQWVFEPATRFGEPVEATVTIPFRFSKRD